MTIKDQYIDGERPYYASHHLRLERSDADETQLPELRMPEE